MKYVLAGLAVVAAVAALIFRPPNGERKSDPAPIANSLPSVPALTLRPKSPASGVSALRQIVVYVAGEVQTPGLYRLGPQQRVADALARAGGAKADADLVAVNLAAVLQDGEEIAFPKVGAVLTRLRPAARPRVHASHAPRGHHRRTGTTADAGAAPQSVDLNSADESLLETLPGIGPSLAARIVAYRDSNGPFSSIDELADVAGITTRLQEELAGVLVIR